MHTHDFDEASCVLEGDLIFQVDDALITKGHWARMAADAGGIEPPEWALRPIPEVTVVGSQIAAQD